MRRRPSLAFYDSALVCALFWARLPSETMLSLAIVVFVYDIVTMRFICAR